jgi:hypothetical protein
MPEGLEKRHYHSVGLQRVTALPSMVLCRWALLARDTRLELSLLSFQPNHRSTRREFRGELPPGESYLQIFRSSEQMAFPFYSGVVLDSELHQLDDCFARGILLVTVEVE